MKEEGGGRPQLATPIRQGGGKAVAEVRKPDGRSCSLEFRRCHSRSSWSVCVVSGSGG